MESIIYRMHQVLDSFTKSERKVYEAILTDSEMVMSSSITELAKKINVSTASITRCCKKIGIGGFPALRLEIARANVKEDGEVIAGESDCVQNASSSEEIRNRIVDTTGANIQILKTIVEPDSLDKTIDMVISSRHILLSGIGASALVAMDFQQKLARIGLMALYGPDQDLQLVQTASFSEKDVVILFSYSGMTEHIKAIAKIAKNQNVPIIAITRKGNSPIGNIADIVLPVAAGEFGLREGATISRLQMLMIVDMLYYGLIKKKKDSLDSIVDTWDLIKLRGSDDSNRS